MSGRLALRVLGPVELVSIEGQTAALPGRLRRLLAVLLVAGGDVVSIDRLSDVLWRDGMPHDPEAALHNLASRLRAQLRALGAQDLVRLQTRSPGYLLEVEREALDAMRFVHLLQQARPLVPSRPAEAAALLDSALALWRGPAYAEFAEDEFAQPEAARLNQLRLTALEDLAEATLMAGHSRAAVAQLEALVAADPLRERPHRQLVLALYRAGRQTDALAVARRYRERLVDELGLDPSPELQRLEQLVLRHDPELGWSATPDHSSPQVTAAPVSPPPSEGPPSSELFGREEDLTDLARTVRPGLLVTLIGPGGVGKTSLARQAAHRLAHAYADGAVTVEFATVTADHEVAAAASTALGLQLRSDPPPLARVVDALAAQRRLLVLDNCEHVLEGAGDLVEALLDGCPEIAILATSRSPLEVAGEHIWVVAPLAAEDAVRLFETRAVRRNRQFVVDQTNAAEVAEICRRLDRLPLAIELAAARMSAMTPAELLGMLSWRFSVLHERLLHGGRRITERHKTLRAVVDWSYGMLEPDTQFAFDVLSVFAGSFTLADADALLSAAAEALRRPRPAGASELLVLLDRSMITIRVASPLTRYAYLETLRAYGRERLDSWDPTLVVQRTHAAMFGQLAVNAGREVFGAEHRRASAALDAAFDELRAAWTWAVEHDLSMAIGLVGSLAYYLELRLPAELGSWADRTLEALEQGVAATGAPVESVSRVRLLAMSAASARFAGDLARARSLAERALTEQARTGESATVEVDIHLRYVLMEICLFQGRLAELDDHAAAAAAFQPTGMMAALVSCTRLLGWAYGGQTAAAIELAERLYLEARVQADDIRRGWTAYGLGEVLIDRDPERADRLLLEALADGRDVGDRYLTGVTLVAIAALRGRHGDLSEAVVGFLDVIEHWRALGDWLHQWSTLRNVEQLLVRADRPGEAALLHGATQARADRFPIFGEDAERQVSLRNQLQRRLGAQQFEDLCVRGRRLSDLEVVELAQRALSSLTAG